jgi:DNA polymerase-3 subunit gamma/tau
VIVEELGLSGMTRMLAQHCELVRQDGNRVELTISRLHERLLDKPYQDKLKAALQQRFGAGVRVTISVGDGNGNSPAALADRDKQQRQAQAVAEIEQDPFVRELVDNFDARIVESTIKPIQQEDGP